MICADCKATTTQSGYCSMCGLYNKPITADRGRLEEALRAARIALDDAQTFAWLPEPLTAVERAEWMTAKGRALRSIAAALVGVEPDAKVET